LRGSVHLDNNQFGDQPRLAPVPKSNFYNGDNNQLAFYFVPRHCSTAKISTSVTWITLSSHSTFVPRPLNALHYTLCLTAKTRAVLRSITALRGDSPIWHSAYGLQSTQHRLLIIPPGRYVLVEVCTD